MAPNTLSGTTSTISDILQASVERSHQLEAALHDALDKIVEYEHQLDDIALGYVSMVAERIDLAAVHGWLENNDTYQKLRDKDLSELLHFSLPEDDEEAVAYIKQKILALEEFLKPLGLPDYDEHIELIFKTITDALQVQEAAAGGIVEVYHELKEGEIREDLHHLTELAHIELPPISPEMEADIETALAELENAMDLWEHRSDPETMSEVLGSLLAHLLPANAPYSEAELKAALKFIFTEVQNIDFSQPDERVVRDVVHRLAELSDQYTMEHPGFYNFNWVVQKISAITCYIIDHDLLRKIRIRRLGPDEPLIPGRPIKDKFPQYAKKKKTNEDNGHHVLFPTIGADASDTAYIDFDFDQVLEDLLEAALSQLDDKTRALAERLRAGDFFSEVTDSFEHFLLDMEGIATEAMEALEAAITAPPPIPLGSLVDCFFEQLQKLVDAFFKGIDDIIKSIVGMVSELAQFVVNLVLAIRLPSQLTNALGLPDVSDINLACYLVALPWETINHLKTTKNGSLQWSLN